MDLYFNNAENKALVEQVLDDGILNAFEDTSLNLVVHNANKMFTVNNCQVAQFGGLTMGYYKNHTVSDATWNAVQAPTRRCSATRHRRLVPTAGLPILVANGTTNNGLDMLRAQFLATALRVQGTPGYGTQQFNVPARPPSTRTTGRSTRSSRT